MNRTHSLAGRQSRWWKEPMVWLIIGLPATAVIAAVLTLFVASTHQDVILDQRYVKQGFTVRSVAELEQRARQLGATVELSVQGDHLTAVLGGDLPRLPATLLLNLSRPDDDGANLQLRLPAVGERRYATTLPVLHAGDWHLAIDPDDQDWRLAAGWRVPFTGRLRLPAAPQPPQP